MILPTSLMQYIILMFSIFKAFGRFQDVIYFHFTKSDTEILEILENWRRTGRHQNTNTVLVIPPQNEYQILTFSNIGRAQTMLISSYIHMKYFLDRVFCSSVFIALGMQRIRQHRIIKLYDCDICTFGK